jgi:hypothetical protein
MRSPTNGVSLYYSSLNPGASKQLDSVLARAGFDRAAFGESSTGIPPGTRVLVPLGPEALRLTAGEENIMRCRGRVFGSGAPWILPTFSPQFLLPRRGEESSSKYIMVVINDIRKAVQIAKEGFQRKTTDYLLDPQPERAWQFAQEYLEAAKLPTTYLCPDIETNGKARATDESEIDEIDFGIIRVNYAFRPHHAMSIPWQGPWMEIHKLLLEHPGKICTWNGLLFDGPVIESNGMHLNGPHYDSMWVWHTYMPNQPKKLEYVSSFCTDLLPWKHLAKSNFAFYGCCDSDSNLQIQLWLEAQMKAQQIPEYGSVAA